MNDAMETLIKQFDKQLTIEQLDYLRFLYENLHIEELSEGEQHYFIDYFFKSEPLRNMAAFALELTDIMHEIQENIPAIEQAERLATAKSNASTMNENGQSSDVKSSSNRQQKAEIFTMYPFMIINKTLVR